MPCDCLLLNLKNKKIELNFIFPHLLAERAEWGEDESGRGVDGTRWPKRNESFKIRNHHWT